MKKGDALPQLLGGIIVLVVIVYITWSFVYGKTPPKPEAEEEVVDDSFKPCQDDVDCIDNMRGSKCGDVYDPNYSDYNSTSIYHCGCWKAEHCLSTATVIRGDICGQNNNCQ